MQEKKSFVALQSASVDGFGQLRKMLFLRHMTIMPFSILSHLGAPGGVGILSLNDATGKKFVVKMLAYFEY